MKTTLKMAYESELLPDFGLDEDALERFAELVREEANARANASWTLMCEKMVAIEREACAKVLDEMAEDMVREMEPSSAIAYVRSKADTIRARGTHET